MGRAVFLASIIVRCYRLFIVFVLNQRKKVLFLSQKFQPKQGAAAPANPTPAVGADGKPLPAIELSSVSSNEIEDRESDAPIGDANSQVSESQDTTSVPSVTIAETSLSTDVPLASPTASNAAPAKPATAANPISSSHSAAGTNETASTKVSRSSKSSNSSMDEYFDLRTNFFKHCTRLYATIPMIIGLSVVFWVLFVVNLPFQYIIGLPSYLAFALNIFGMCIATLMISVGVLLLFFALRKVNDTFNQSKELLFLLLTCISSIFTQFGLISPWWPAIINAIGSIITGTILLFAGGIYPLHMAWRFRKQIVDHMINSMDEMEDFLKNPVALSYFTDFARNEFALENLLFWLDVKKYKELCRASKRRDAIKAMDNIVTKYMNEKSIYELNVPRLHINDVMNFAAKLKEDRKNVPPVDLFEPVEKVIATTLLWDSFPRFRASRYYRELNERLETVREQVTVMM